MAVAEKEDSFQKIDLFLSYSLKATMNVAESRAAISPCSPLVLGRLSYRREYRRLINITGPNLVFTSCFHLHFTLICGLRSRVFRKAPHRQCGTKSADKIAEQLFLRTHFGLLEMVVPTENVFISTFPYRHSLLSIGNPLVALASSL